MMTAHLGLPMAIACTDVGLDPGAAQWYAFLDPERLAVDLERGRLRRSGRTGRARRARNSAAREQSGGGGDEDRRRRASKRQEVIVGERVDVGGGARESVARRIKRLDAAVLGSEEIE